MSDQSEILSAKLRAHMHHIRSSLWKIEYWNKLVLVEVKKTESLSHLKGYLTSALEEQRQVLTAVNNLRDELEELWTSQA